jgi:hypothetical protein
LTPLPLDVAGVEGLGSGSTDGPPEVGVVCALLDGVADAPVGELPAQLAAGVGLSSAARLEVLARGLELVLPDALAEALSLALAVALSVGVAAALVVALPFGLALALAVSPGLAVSVPLSDGLAVLGDAVTLGLVGAPVVAADRVGLDVLGFGELDEGDADGDTHGTAEDGMIPGVALPSTPLGPEPWPVLPGPAELAVLLGEPANTSVLT